MPRSVVLAGAARCPCCSQPPRWCICDAVPKVSSGLLVHVLIHHNERHKPSSTGSLIGRVVDNASCHVYRRQSRIHDQGGVAPDALDPGREIWVLHPRGEPIPAAAAATGGPPFPQVVLLDGTWRQAGEMLRTVAGLGKLVRLPEQEPSRYWLRDQREPTQVSTAEALLAVFRAVGDAAAERCLRLHFELHVYATLRSRGQREMAERYLGESPLLDAIPEFLDRLNARHGPERPEADSPD
jgi:DTW domain-containing protein YfiP